MGSHMNSIELFQNINEESKIELEKILKIKKCQRKKFFFMREIWWIKLILLKRVKYLCLK